MQLNAPLTVDGSISLVILNLPSPDFHCIMRMGESMALDVAIHSCLDKWRAVQPLDQRIDLLKISRAHTTRRTDLQGNGVALL
jgi:hypothetical protein